MFCLYFTFRDFSSSSCSTHARQRAPCWTISQILTILYDDVCILNIEKFKFGEEFWHGSACLVFTYPLSICYFTIQNFVNYINCIWLIGYLLLRLSSQRRCFVIKKICDLWILWKFYVPLFIYSPHVWVGRRTACRSWSLPPATWAWDGTWVLRFGNKFLYLLSHLSLFTEPSCRAIICEFLNSGN